MADLAFGLAGALTASDVLDVVADTGRRLVDAAMVNISLLDPSRAVLRLVSSRHTPDAVVEEFAEYPAGDPHLPTSRVLGTGRPVLIGSIADRDRDWPALRGVDVVASSFAVCPLSYAGRKLGVIGFGWPREQPRFDPELVARVEEVARLCSTALARTQLFHREAQARTRAERTTARLRVLQELTLRLACAPDPAALGATVTTTAVDTFGAAAAAVAVLEGDDLVVVATHGLTPLGRPAARLPLTDVPEAVDVLHSASAAGPTSTDRTALPLFAAGRPVGLLWLTWPAGHRPDVEDLAVLDIVAAHTAVILDRIRLLQRTQSTADVLQRALLPAQAPLVPGWDVGVCYLPAVEGVQVGGDWHDVFGLPDGRLMVVVGDVMGKGTHAATVMGSVRSAVRAFATADPTPSVILDEVDAYLSRFAGDELATCVVGTLDPPSGRLLLSSAGHPPALLCGGGREVRWLEEAGSTPLGVGLTGARPVLDVQVGVGQVLLLYTDGLVEDRRIGLEEGLAALAHAAGGLPDGDDLTADVAALAAGLTAQHAQADDVAVVALRRRPW